MMSGDFVDDTGGTMTKGMRVSELIMEDLQKEDEVDPKSRTVFLMS